MRDPKRAASAAPDLSSLTPHPSSPTPTPCRLVIDAAAPGPWNMAVDEALWMEAAEGGPCCWRFYRWSEPTLSLGYFQRYEDRLLHPASGNCAVVRRLSGGGAIMHDVELTYSLVLPAGHPLAARRLFLYRAVHGALIEALARFGVNASLHGGRLDGGRRQPATLAPQPFLCFQRRSEGDVVAGGIKIGGSAQRRSRGAVLQHGSVLLGRSAAAPELGSIGELTQTPPDSESLITTWGEVLQARLGLVLEPRQLDRIQEARAAKLADTKYATDRWTKNRGR